MRKNTLGMILPGIALLFAAGCSDCRKNDALTVIHRRTSVRSYQQKKVGRDLLTKIVRAGMAAPTAMNAQPWAFIVVDDRTVLNSLEKGLGWAKMLKKAPAAIIVCGNMKKALKKGREFWIQDCSAATQNVLLAAEALGLGAVWTAGYPVPHHVKHVQKTLALPEHVIPLAIIALGYPDGNFIPKNKWKPENLHWQKW